jgi:acyl-coenzyme A synthetase/AMP-(fatty) acid ligase
MTDEDVLHPLLVPPFVDASLRSIFGPLILGRTCWLATEQERADIAILIQNLGTGKQLGLSCTPSNWRTILRRLKNLRTDTSRMPIRQLILGGEPVDSDLIEHTFQWSANLEVWNLYGLTETTAVTCAAKLTRNGPITLGQPIDNVQVHVLDEKLQAMPVGHQGELYVSGAGVANGYLHRADLTAERFLQDKFAGNGTRMYKSGDCCRMNPDGTLSFIGRLDDQVKVQGKRVDIAEVTARIREQILVCDVIVLPLRSRLGDTQLVGYIEVDNPTNATSRAIRSALAQSLPSYMIPTHIVVLPVLPRTPFGKIDRARLPRTSDLPKTYHAAASSVQRLVTQVWQEVLGLSEIDPEDNFFDIGGYSLLATEISARLSEILGIQISPQLLFTHSSLTHFSHEVSVAMQMHEGTQS